MLSQINHPHLDFVLLTYITNYNLYIISTFSYFTHSNLLYLHYYYQNLILDIFVLILHLLIVYRNLR